MNRFLVKVLFVLIVCISCSLTLVSCKAKAKVVQENKKEDTNRMNAERIIKNFYTNKSEFTTLYIKSNVKYYSIKNISK